MPFPKIDLLVLDTETTGFIPRTHRVIEYAAAKIENGTVVKEYETLLGVDGDIPPHVEVLTRIRTADLKGQPTFAEKKSDIESMLTQETIIVGQNIGYDIGMLRGEGLDLTGHECIDTSLIASVVFPEFESYSLGYMSEMLRLEHTPKHRALGDVRATVGVLEKCFDRLSKLPTNTMQEIMRLAERGPKGYRLFFEAIEGASGTSTPSWLTMPSYETFKPEHSIDLAMCGEPKGVAELVEESLDPAFIEEVLHDVCRENGIRHFVAVKNLEATVRRIDLPKRASVLYPPHVLLDPESAKNFLSQETFTADELILAIKLLLYKPKKQDDAPLHGEDKHIWSGKLACTFESETYIETVAKLSSVVLLDHRQLLAHIEMKNLPPETTHIVFDDASMLEDTATRAFGWYAAMASLRKAAANDLELTKYTDLLQLWIEKTRGGTDIRYLTTADLTTKDAAGLTERLLELLKGDLSSQTRAILEHVQKIIDPANIGGRITWIEVYQNGDQVLQSVPESIATLLRDTVFSDFSVTLLIPPKSADMLGAILPRGQEKKILSLAGKYVHELPIQFPTEWNLDAWIESAKGKSVVLLNSRRAIEDAYVKHAEKCEERGVSLFCQGMSGGQSRMQAEFGAVKGDAILLVTPWTYEGFELPPNCVDHLFIHALPFDHPSHAVIGKRCEQFADPFNEYSLPRVMHRTFRLLRTFSRHRTETGDVAVLDARLFTKEYGKKIRAYLEGFSVTTSLESKEEKPVEPLKKAKKLTASTKTKKKDEPPAAQQTLF